MKLTKSETTISTKKKIKATLELVGDVYDEMLRDPEVACEYMNEHLKQGDPALFRKAVGKIIKAQGGISNVVLDLNLNRTNLSVALTEKGDPSFDLMFQVLMAMGVELSCKRPRKKAR